MKHLVRLSFAICSLVVISTTFAQYDGVSFSAMQRRLVDSLAGD